MSEVVATVGLCLATIDGTYAETVAALVEDVRTFEAHDPEYALEQVLSELALGGKGGAPTEGGGVKVATFHRTKGLQWPHVYLIGLEDETLPDFLSTSLEALQEERRLCFVGVCRAEDSLTLTRVRGANLVSSKGRSVRSAQASAAANGTVSPIPSLA